MVADTNKYPYPYKTQTEIPAKRFVEFDSVKFVTLFWPAVTKPKARILIVHGFGEHTHLQYRLMDHLALHGYESFTFDQRGAGETSPGKERGKTNEYYTFHDLDHFILQNYKECEAKKIPLVLFGHSMGGGIILQYGIRGTHREKIAAYSTTAPLIVLHPDTAPFKAVDMVAPVLANLLPNYRTNTGLNVDGIAGSEEYKQFLLHDTPLSMPLYGSLRQIYDFLKRGKELDQNANGYVNGFVQRPLLIMHGEADTINDPAASKRFSKRCTLEDSQLKLYPGMVHSLLSLESDEHFEQVFSDYAAWLDRSVSA